MCKKQGHTSRGAAEAHLRGLLRIQELKQDKKRPEKLNVYICTDYRCRKAPYHVGHSSRR